MDPQALASKEAGSRKRTLSPGRPSRQDVIAGFVSGLFSIPEGMAYASIAGFNPVLGLYSGMVPTFLGSVFARTVLMATTLIMTIFGLLKLGSLMEFVTIAVWAVASRIKRIETLATLIALLVASVGVAIVGDRGVTGGTGTCGRHFSGRAKPGWQWYQCLGCAWLGSNTSVLNHHSAGGSQRHWVRVGLLLCG
jgi:hypothetical protein